MKAKILVALSNDKVRTGLKITGIVMAMFTLAIGDATSAFADGPVIPG